MKAKGGKEMNFPDNFLFLSLTFPFLPLFGRIRNLRYVLGSQLITSEG